ncbi:MAG: protein-glutamate O-methyltransferase, partial [Anaerolineae bacterium]|nr:protein-glutamate O-methyltransferase [Anaerolineae bacterium]
MMWDESRNGGLVPGDGGRVLLAEADFLRFCDLVRARSGMEFNGPRRNDLERAIGRALAETGLPSPQALYERLAAGADQSLCESFIASLTIPETYFFRNRPQFEALEQHILPDLIARRREQRRLRIWSAGCASGEEPYSLAILLRRLLPDLASWDVLILATDLNRSLLAKAQAGIYSAWSFRETPSDIRDLYFTPRGARFELSAEVRRQVTFAYLNLAEDTYPSPLTNTHEMDLILFRNVLIYFNTEMARRVVERLYRALTDGGWLLVGHAEPSITLFDRFTEHYLAGAIVYRKEAAPIMTAPAALPMAVPVPPAARNGPRPAAAETRVGGSLPVESSGPRARRRPAAAPANAPAPQPSPPAEDLLAQYRAVRSLADQSQLTAALRSVEALIHQAPLFAPAYYLQGLILQELGDTEGAVAALRRCVYVDPGFVMGHFALANLYA